MRAECTFIGPGGTFSTHVPSFTNSVQREIRIFLDACEDAIADIAYINVYGSNTLLTSTFTLGRT